MKKDNSLFAIELHNRELHLYWPSWVFHEEKEVIKEEVIKGQSIRGSGQIYLGKACVPAPLDEALGPVWSVFFSLIDWLIV